MVCSACKIFWYIRTQNRGEIICNFSDDICVHLGNSFTFTLGDCVSSRLQCKLNKLSRYFPVIVGYLDEPLITPSSPSGSPQCSESPPTVSNQKIHKRLCEWVFKTLFPVRPVVFQRCMQDCTPLLFIARGLILRI